MVSIISGNDMVGRNLGVLTFSLQVRKPVLQGSFINRGRADTYSRNKQLLLKQCYARKQCSYKSLFAARERVWCYMTNEALPARYGGKKHIHSFIWASVLAPYVGESCSMNDNFWVLPDYGVSEKWTFSFWWMAVCQAVSTTPLHSHPFKAKQTENMWRANGLAPFGGPCATFALCCSCHSKSLSGGNVQRKSVCVRWVG